MEKETEFSVPFIETVITSVANHFPHIQEMWQRRYHIYCSDQLETNSVAACVFTYFIAFVFIYLLYAKCLQGFLKKMELAEMNRSYLVEAMWYFVLCVASISGCVGKLMFDYNVDSFQNAYHMFLGEKAFVSEDKVPNHLVFIFILFCALSAHSVWLTWSREGFNIEFFTRLCFFLFFCSTYPLRCVLLGLVCMLLININAVCAEITRIFCILNWKKSLRVYCMRYISYIFFSVYCACWSVAFLYILPTRVLRRTITMHVRVPEDIPALVLLNGALMVFLWLQLLWAPASVVARRLACSLGRQHHLLDSALFPSRNAILAELRAVCIRIRQQEAERAKHFTSQSFIANEEQKNASKRTLFQTVKCIIALKRRLRRRRESQDLVPEDISIASPDVTTHDSD